MHLKCYNCHQSAPNFKNNGIIFLHVDNYCQDSLENSCCAWAKSDAKTRLSTGLAGISSSLELYPRSLHSKLRCLLIPDMSFEVLRLHEPPCDFIAVFSSSENKNKYLYIKTDDCYMIILIKIIQLRFTKRNIISHHCKNIKSTNPSSYLVTGLLSFFLYEIRDKFSKTNYCYSIFSYSD